MNNNSDIQCSSKRTMSALEAISQAQYIAFAPMLFQSALCLRDYGILAFIESSQNLGVTREAIYEHCSLSKYSIDVLLDMGISGQLVEQKENFFYLTKIAHFILHDPMTRVNMDFTQDVCYQGLYNLGASLESKTPVGLRHLTDSETIYPVLNQLPDKMKKSWFAFDHFYSDNTFGQVLPYVFSLKPKLIYDIGGNTGKWAVQCCRYDQHVQVMILDLPQQIKLTQKNLTETHSPDIVTRISGHPVNILNNEFLPTDADVWWMSQFLDCFSEEQIIFILNKIAHIMKPEARICILELFPDRQQYDAAKFSLNASSLYFTCMANGYSRFYQSEPFFSYIKQAGLEIEQSIDHLGIGHTLLICRKK